MFPSLTLFWPSASLIKQSIHYFNNVHANTSQLPSLTSLALLPSIAVDTQSASGIAIARIFPRNAHCGAERNQPAAPGERRGLRITDWAI